MRDDYQFYCDLKLNKISHILVHILAKFFYRHGCLRNFNYFKVQHFPIILFFNGF